MIAYKGFTKDLTCTRGEGVFQYEIGKTYKESGAKCVSMGFHCVEEPIEVLKWYSEHDARYCIVQASGDVHEDGDAKIACSEITILREITLQQLGALECKWLQEHPDRTMNREVKKDCGSVKENEIVIVRGKNPKASGRLGSTIFLLKEDNENKEIKEIGIFEIDGKDYLPDVWYRTDGRRCR